jgi:hypothetical protein
LLEAGVVVYEWNGPMVHAKTAVCDGFWARVGSTNLNLSSWIGNWEIDVVIENSYIARKMASMFLEDLNNATEVVITGRNKVRPVVYKPKPYTAGFMRSSGHGVITKAVSAGSVFKAAVTGKSSRSPAESAPLFSMGLILCGLSVGIVMLPKLFAYSIAGLLSFTGILMAARALKLRLSRSSAAHKIRGCLKNGPNRNKR